MSDTDGAKAPTAGAPNRTPKQISRRSFLAGVSAAAITAGMPAVADEPLEWVYLTREITLEELLRRYYTLRTREGGVG